MIARRRQVMSNRPVSLPEIADLPPHLRRHLLDRFQREDFEAFVHRAFCVVTPGQDYAHNWHISAIAHALDKVRRGESKRLIIAMPPRYLKSLSVSIAFPAFLLGHDPTLRIIAASYAESLAVAHSNDFRRLVQSKEYKRLFPKRVSIRLRTQKARCARQSAASAWPHPSAVR